MQTLVHCNPVQGQYRARTGFSLCSFPHREKPVFISWDPCNENRVFSVRKTTQGKTLFSLQGWVCSVVKV